MFWLVNADFSAPGKGQASKLPPTLFTHLRDLHVLRFEISQGRRKVVAHEEKLVLVVLRGIMERGLKWRHGENQPAVTSINAGKMEHIAKEGPVGLRVLGVDNNMRSVDQRENSWLLSVALYSHCASTFATGLSPGVGEKSPLHSSFDY